MQFAMVKGADERKQGGEVDFDCVAAAKKWQGGRRLGIFWAHSLNLSPSMSPPQGFDFVKMGLSRGAFPLLRLHVFFLSARDVCFCTVVPAFPGIFGLPQDFRTSGLKMMGGAID